MRHMTQRDRNRSDRAYYGMAFRLLMFGVIMFLAFIVTGHAINKAQAIDPRQPFNPTVEKVAPPPPPKSIGLITGRWCLDTPGPCITYGI